MASFSNWTKTHVLVVVFVFGLGLVDEGATEGRAGGRVTHHGITWKSRERAAESQVMPWLETKAVVRLVKCLCSDTRGCGGLGRTAQDVVLACAPAALVEVVLEGREAVACEAAGVEALGVAADVVAGLGVVAVEHGGGGCGQRVPQFVPGHAVLDGGLGSVRVVAFVHVLHVGELLERRRLQVEVLGQQACVHAVEGAVSWGLAFRGVVSWGELDAQRGGTVRSELRERAVSQLAREPVVVRVDVLDRGHVVLRGECDRVVMATAGTGLVGVEPCKQHVDLVVAEHAVRGVEVREQVLEHFGGMWALGDEVAKKHDLGRWRRDV